MGSKMIETAYIDISESQNVAEMVFSLGQSLDSGDFDNKKVVLNLGETELNQAQLTGLKTLIEGVDSVIDFVHSTSSKTKLSALTTGISIANQKDGEYTKEECDVISAQKDILLDELLPSGTDFSAQLGQGSKKDVIKDMQYVELETEYSNQAEDNEILERRTIQEYEVEQSDDVVTEVPVREFILDENQYKDNGDTVYITQTIRSGQVVSYDGNVVIIGDCNPGSEIVASGDITVWGVLNGIAHAGACGNEKAVIRALNIDAIQLRISKYFARRPDRANIEFTEKTNTFTPEEARVEDGGIYIYTLNNKN